MSIRYRTQDGVVHDTDLAERQLNLLAHAQAIELDIGSRCGGHGVCGGDRVRIAEKDRADFSPVTEHEREHLSESELAQGYRLACQCFPERDGLECQLSVDLRS